MQRLILALLAGSLLTGCASTPGDGAWLGGFGAHSIALDGDALTSEIRTVRGGNRIEQIRYAADGSWTHTTIEPSDNSLREILQALLATMPR